MKLIYFICLLILAYGITIFLISRETYKNDVVLLSMLKNDVNFGDAVSDIFFSKLSDKKIKAVDIHYGKDSYLTTGSILRLCNKNHTVIGSGFISDDDDLGKGDWKTYTNKVYNIPKKILSVRGPKTRAKLKAMGIDCPQSYGDPLTIFPLVYKKNMPEHQITSEKISKPKVLKSKTSLNSHSKRSLVTPSSARRGVCLTPAAFNFFVFVKSSLVIP
jgi:hypothetical protein